MLSLPSAIFMQFHYTSYLHSKAKGDYNVFPVFAGPNLNYKINILEMKIATWNVNSITARLLRVLEWVKSNRPDIVCLQEIKCIDQKFPSGEFEQLGYRVETFGQPTYNGVAILSLLPLSDIQRGLPDDDDGAQRRLIAATINSIRVVNVYVPNGQAVGTEKYLFKLEWLARLRNFFDVHYDVTQPVILCGDFNVAPEDRDVHDPVLWEGQILCSEAERAALKKVQNWGLIDLFRKHQAEGGYFTWWDYRQAAFRLNHGLRIDHLWATEPLAQRSISVWIDKIARAMEKPSDHAPVVAEFSLVDPKKL
jgi:exodeoxyribonuclease III